MSIWAKIEGGPAQACHYRVLVSGRLAEESGKFGGCEFYRTGKKFS
jgi:hypothetical protein